MDYYEIRFTFRGHAVPATVHEHKTHCEVFCSHQEVLKDFRGRFEFTLPDKKFIQDYQRNEDAKDLPDLIRAMKAELR